MRHQLGFMRIRKLDKRLINVVLIGLVSVLLLVSVNSISAQSGRRVPKGTLPTPTPAPEPEETPKPAPKAEIKPEYTIKVVSYLPLSLNQEFPYPENMPRWVVERLRSSKLLEVEYQSSANRKEAIEMAKDSEQAFVLLVELDENSFGDPQSRRTKAESGNIWINFYLYTPVTGKVKQQGRAMFRPELLNNNRQILSTNRNCYPPNNSDYLLREASFEVAERILSGFNLSVPPFVCK
jgi:hypothetical protein